MNKILDDYLCKKYPKILVNRSKTPFESCLGRGFELGNGWFPLIDSLFSQIQYHIDTYNIYNSDKPVPQFVVEQMKEKFGQIRCYFSGGDEYCEGLVSMTETLSYQVCEICGIAGYLNVGHTEGWIQSVCKKCAERSKRIIRFGPLSDMLEKAIMEDDKEIFDFYASR